MEKPQVADSSADKRRFQLRCLILAAAALHMSVTLTIFIIGRHGLFPSQIDPSGIGRFASDGNFYQGQIAELAHILKNEGLRAWATWPTQLHIRLYAVPYAIVSRWVSFNILTIEPLNLFYYLAIVLLVFKLAESIFDRRTGLIAAAIVALWPSFLLHTTQLLRDPLLILCVLVLVWSVIQFLQRDYSWRRALLLGLGSIASIVIIRIVRLPMWYVIVATVAAAVVLHVIAAIRRRRLNPAAAAYVLLIVIGVIITPKLQPYFHNQQELRRNRVIDSEKIQQLSLEEQIEVRRRAFSYVREKDGEALLDEEGSRIDAEVSFHSPREIVRHVPRAIVVGFFAPFPNMWLRAGKQVGRSGRVISGFETLLTYVIETLALLGLWSARRKLSAWFLVIVIGLGAVALGLVVNNIGAMYRLRYPFWMLMVVLGAGGVSFLARRFQRSNTSVA